MLIQVIKTDKEIARLKRDGVFLRLNGCAVLFLKNDGNIVRVAIRIKKSVGKAYVRNKARRRIKSILKKALSTMEISCGVDLLITWIEGEPTEAVVFGCVNKILG